MNLEEKAQEYVKKVGFTSNENREYCMTDYKSGYKECTEETITFLRANPKITVEQIIKHLEELK